MSQPYTVEVETPRVEAGKCYRIGGPDELIDVVVLVERIRVRTTVEVTADLRVSESSMSHAVSYQRATVLAVIQQGRRPGMDEIPPGTPWETDDRWNFVEVEWENPRRSTDED